MRERTRLPQFKGQQFLLQAISLSLSVVQILECSDRVLNDRQIKSAAYVLHNSGAGKSEAVVS